MTNNSVNNKRIAKNTLLLYFRMLLLMAVSLYTSRVILNALGAEDFGIYNVVGGLVTMFSIISGSITVSISRFITFELGKGDKGDVSKVFSSAVNVQICMSVIIFVLMETIGLWFLNHRMVFPESRAYAVNWVFQLTIVTFLVNLLSVPYNAAIIAHEKMSAFAYISILEALLKLGIAFCIIYTDSDKLIVYAVLMMLVSVAIRSIYSFYCRRNFSECIYRFILDKSILKNMFSYAGWTYIGSSAALLRDQGGNILINLFFGPTVNAARGIAVQVQSAVNQFAVNFITALNPQITKNYAAGDYERVKFLIRVGALAGYFLLLLIALPILFNTPYILKLWLKDVPADTVIFVQLAILFAMSEAISNPLITAASASGRIRNYQLLVGGIQFLNFPIAYLVFRLGFPSYTVLVIAIVLSQCCLAARLYILRKMIKLSAKAFLEECYVKIILVSLLALIIPALISQYVQENFVGLIISTIACTLSSVTIIYFIGCSRHERVLIYDKLYSVYYKIRKKK